MPWHRDTITTLSNRIKGDLASSLNLAQIPRRSILEVLGKVVAGSVHGLYGYGSYIINQIFPFSAEHAYLERHAKWWGIERKKASFAHGKVIFKGIENTVFPQGINISSDDILLISISSANTLNGQVEIEVKAQNAGSASNLPVATKLSLISPLAGIMPEGEVSEAISGGTDIENDDNLRQRLIFRIQNPPAGGNAKDYELWAISQEKHGVAVTKAWISPLEMGIGTVSIRFVTENGIPSISEVAILQSYIDSVRPITAHVFVLAPIAKVLNFRISGLNPASYQVQLSVEKELRDLIRREAKPNGILLISHIREAISIAVGEMDHVLESPVANVHFTGGELCTFGVIEWT